jgi:hypothetical protein
VTRQRHRGAVRGRSAGPAARSSGTLRPATGPSGPGRPRNGMHPAPSKGLKRQRHPRSRTVEAVVGPGRPQLGRPQSRNQGPGPRERMHPAPQQLVQLFDHRRGSARAWMEEWPDQQTGGLSIQHQFEFSCGAEICRAHLESSESRCAPSVSDCAARAAAGAERRWPVP